MTNIEGVAIFGTVMIKVTGGMYGEEGIEVDPGTLTIYPDGMPVSFYGCDCVTPAPAIAFDHEGYRLVLFPTETSRYTLTIGTESVPVLSRNVSKLMLTYDQYMVERNLEEMTP